jgi:hypothetical protein
MLRKILLPSVAAIIGVSAWAQETAKEEEKPATKFSGFVDVYYKYDLSNSAANNYTSFTNSHNSFELGMASLKVEHSIGKVSMVADLGFGKRAREFSYNDDGITASIKQLFVSYAAADWIKFTMGSWATHVGYELVDAPANRNYSMAYMFSWGPFFHTGLKADITAGKHGFMLGVANPTDLKFSPLSAKKYAIAQYSFAASDNFKAYLNYVGGKRSTDSAKTNQIDLVVIGKVSDKFSIGYDGTVASTKTQTGGKYGDAQSWWGSALYLNVDPKPSFGLTLRGELFDNKKYLLPIGTEGASIFATTLSANIKVGSLIIIPEFRFESSGKDIYSNKSGTPKSSAANLLLAAVYTF